MKKFKQYLIEAAHGNLPLLYDIMAHNNEVRRHVEAGEKIKKLTGNDSDMQIPEELTARAAELLKRASEAEGISSLTMRDGYIKHTNYSDPINEFNAAKAGFPPYVFVKPKGPSEAALHAEEERWKREPFTGYYENRYFIH